ncbi:hypothetical protein [Lewinella sp. JB7]|uniref:hypothetical protein n=1 Tax=Lewinella sp. JB7 TaxID=2962887 RepID=UPI0020C9E902|nr:hypothetical protein [Lewinella sp. JB7]MCP9237937.1 hypothetical protein [Lewinella sp. JB7]
MKYIPAIFLGCILFSISLNLMLLAEFFNEEAGSVAEIFESVAHSLLLMASFVLLPYVILGLLVMLISAKWKVQTLQMVLFVSFGTLATVMLIYYSENGRIQMDSFGFGAILGVATGIGSIPVIRVFKR